MKFSEKEKTIIRHLIEYCKGSYFSDVSSFLSKYVLKEGTALMAYANRDYPNAFFSYAVGKLKKEELNTLYFDTLTAVTLIQKLIDNGMISSIRREYNILDIPDFYVVPHESIKIKGELQKGRKTNSCSFELEEGGKIIIDDDVWRDGSKKDYSDQYEVIYNSITINKSYQLFDFFDSVIHINQELSDLVKHNFKTVEERSLCVGKVAVYVATITMFFSIGSSLHTMHTTKKTDKEQYYKIIFKQDSLLKVLLTTNDAQKFDDKLDTITNNK